MIIWIFRAIALLVTPAITYFTVSHDAQGLLLGLIIGVVLIGVEYMLENTSLSTLFIAVAGAVIGIVFAKLLDYTVAQTDNQWLIMQWSRYNMLARYALALLGMIIGVKKIAELDDLDRNIVSVGKRSGRSVRLLDISAIVDGRIIDLCETRFITGPLAAPRFIVQELNSLAGSNEPIKRAKGRRGLDILARLQENKEIPFKIMDRDVKELQENSMKLVRVAAELGASIITTDFNINKLAALENVTTLNINDLTLALKPVYLPGEDMQVFVMKDGKEREQGVGYLDDGTMIVVEEGREFIGKKIDVTVQSILQTSQGRIIFTKLKNSRKETRQLAQEE